jgi:hypothetical protein
MPSVANSHWVFNAKEDRYCVNTDWTDFCGYRGSAIGGDALARCFYFYTALPLSSTQYHAY